MGNTYSTNKSNGSSSWTLHPRSTWAPYTSGTHAITARNVTDPTGRVVIETRPYGVARFHNGGWIGMFILAAFLLIMCALLAGLTLAVCGLDTTLLKLRCVTGSPRERRHARMVAGMRQHSTWMLFSLIICSVACGETFPFIISTLYHGNQIWVPILASTGLIATFAEILPQYFMPRQAISWGYYFWPLIWGCMWLTAIISYPLAYLMDLIASKSQKDEYGIFSNDDLATIIRYHERSEKNGGKLGQEAARIMLGALNLDSRKIGGEIYVVPRKSDESERDAEKADLIVVQGMIVKWDMAKTIDINEKVDKAFIKKVRMWSYSRIPVIEQSADGEDGGSTDSSAWDGTKIFGFLHVKNLIGVDLDGKRSHDDPLLVKDLPLYPLPIVRDDISVYELLNMFQLGMSRIAVVVPAAPKAPLTVMNDSWGFESTRWTGTERTNNRIKSKLKASKAKFNWTIDYLQAAQLSADDSLLQRHRIHGIRSPKPIGIITFEDIIDTILQKTSRDENDFFDRSTSTPPTKGKKAGDYSPRPVIGGIAPNSTIPVRKSKNHISFVAKSNQKNVLRKRKTSDNENPTNLDGAYEHSCNSGNSGSMRQQKTRKDSVESSYTQNSRGGFHGANLSDSSIYPAIMLSMMNSEDLAELAYQSYSDCLGNPHSPTRTSSLPSRKSRSALGSEAQRSTRHASAAPILPTVRRVTPFSRNTSSYERSEDAKEAAGLVMPVLETVLAPAPGSPRPSFDHNASGTDLEDAIWQEHFARGPDCENNDLITLNSSDEEEDLDEQNSVLYNAFPVPASEENNGTSFSCDLQTIEEEEKKRPYDGFPPELLEARDENRISNYNSKTMPRLGQDTLVREQSFHDDRAMLPSQKQVVKAEDVIVGARSSSLWW